MIKMMEKTIIPDKIYRIDELGYMFNRVKKNTIVILDIPDHLFHQISSNSILFILYVIHTSSDDNLYMLPYTYNTTRNTIPDNLYIPRSSSLQTSKEHVNSHVIVNLDQPRSASTNRHQSTR